MALTPHPKNATGDYYVERDCCTLCSVPWHVATELFSYNDAGCWVSRQPNDGAEEEKMHEVIAIQELGCIRYRGKEQRVLHALAQRGEEKQCDHPLRGRLASRLMAWFRSSRQ